MTNIKENSFYVDEFMDNQYVNNSENVNIYDTNWAWGANFSDFNNDGFEDLFIANGFSVHEENEFFINISAGSQSIQSSTLLPFKNPKYWVLGLSPVALKETYRDLIKGLDT